MRYELYVGGLNPETTEKDLEILFNKVAQPIEINIKRNNEGTSKGYGYVTFSSEEEVNDIINNFQNYVLNDYHLDLKENESNNILFCGGIRKNWDEKNIVELITNVVANVSKVIVVSDADSKEKNRGYCFIRFEDHQSAVNALARISKDEFLLGGQKIKPNWADTQSDFDASDGVNVFILYFRKKLFIFILLHLR